MPSPIRMPQLGESVTEGTVLRWLKHPGDHVDLDESLAEVETEKVNVEIPSPFEGTLVELLVPEGETVDVGVPIATIETTTSAEAAPSAAPPAQATVPVAPAAPAAPPAAAAPAVRAEPVSSAPVPQQRAPAFGATGPLGPASTAHGMFSTGESGETPAPPMVEARTPVPAPPAPNGAAGAARYSPAVLRLAGEHGIDLKLMSGTGEGGRITRKDVQAWIDRGGSARPVQPGSAGGKQHVDTGVTAPVAALGTPVVDEVQESLQPPTSGPPPVVAEPAARATESPIAPVAAAATPPRPLGDDEELEPLTSTRKAIAAHMVRSVQTSPHAWMMIEVDLSRLVAYRERIKALFREREGVDLSYLPFMVKATVAALKQHPRLNSSWSDQGVILKRRIGIGIAVDTPAGLVVPVVKDADNLSIAGLARAIGDLAARARARRLRMEDIEGGTFTVDNVGPIGSIISQPIINQPQCAIVTMESIVRRPVVIDDAIAIRSMMNCCISFDHRIVDGGDIGPFMKTLKQNLEAMGDDTPIY